MHSVCDQHPAPGTFSCYAVRRTDIKQYAKGHFHPATANSPAVTPSGYGPSDLASAYNLPSASGSGQRVYIIDAYDDPNAESDLAVYRSQYGLPACTTANGCFQKLNQSGQTTPLPRVSPTNDDWTGEESLDLDAVSATCPNCSITVMEAADDSDNLFTAVHEAVALGARFVSMSWGGSDLSNDSGYDSSYFNHAGVVFTASTGDTGYQAGPNYPATSPDVVAVGGTSLVKNGSSRGWGETVWNDDPKLSATGSGCSLYEAKPSWQSSIANSDCANRAEADVSADADPETGLAVYDTYRDSGWDVYGGTSASSPEIAGVYALAGTPSTTVVPQQKLWNTESSLNDVVSGNNGTCSTKVCNAAVGWDGPTGLGTPDGTSAFTTAPVTAIQAPGTYLPVQGTRLLDTRSGVGVSKAGARPAGTTTALQVGGNGSVPPDGVEAVALNVTAVSPAKSGYVTAWAGGTRPNTSNVSFAAGKTQANLITAPVSSSGVVDLYNSQSTQLLADVVGYWVGGTVGDAGAYQPITPARALDTRNGTGATTGPVTSGQTVTVQLTGSGHPLPTGTKSAVVSLTAVSPTGAGHVTAWSGEGSQPSVSSLNYAKGITVANAAIVPLGSDGTLHLNVNTTTQLLADVVGYYLPGNPTLSGTFHAVSPDRLLDTRPGGVAANGVRTVDVHDDSDLADSDVAAVALNLTSVSSSAAGHLTAYPDGTSNPGTSNLNFAKGQTLANLALVQVSSGGGLDVASSASTNVLADIAGYYQA